MLFFSMRADPAERERIHKTPQRALHPEARAA
jgi:hypothetical protein